jgi:uncharacterized protein DUF4145
MTSWWEFGEHTGYNGSDLSLFRVACAFCNTKGNFENAHREQKKHATTRKILNFDTLKCGNCGNFIMIFWSASEFGGSRGMHNFITVPWAREITKFPEHWPEDIGRHWLQARRSLEGQNWDAASLMARSAIQLIARYQKAKGANLKQEINDLASRGILPPIMKDWSHEVRELANESAHPDPGSKGTTSKDAHDVVEFLSVLLQITYDLPHQIKQYRARKNPKGVQKRRSPPFMSPD